MPLVSSQVRVAGTGELFLAEVGTAMPALSAAEPADFTGYGYTTEDGVTLSKSVEREGIPAWQSTTPVRYLTTSQELTAACTFLQSNRDILQLWLAAQEWTGDQATGFKAEIDIDPVSLQFAMWLVWRDGPDLASGLFIPKVEITETGDVNLARTAATAFPITFGALAPDTGNALAIYTTNDPAFAAAIPAP